MSAERATQLAERCFALARSTTFAGEREAAISRGIAIAEKAQISLDRFDIPGRARAAAPHLAASFSARPDWHDKGDEYRWRRGIFADAARKATAAQLERMVYRDAIAAGRKPAGGCVTLQATFAYLSEQGWAASCVVRPTDARPTWILSGATGRKQVRAPDLYALANRIGL